MKSWQRWLVSIFIALMSIVLIAPFFVPVSVVGSDNAHALADADSRFVELPLGSDSIEVHYKEAGTGEPALLLLHGFGASVFSWREVMAPLAEQHREIAFDRPAFGLTERPLRGAWGTAAEWSRGIPYGAEAQADLTIALMDELGVEQAVLVGNSAGGAVSIITALNYPERVKALILISPAVYGGGPNAVTRWLLQTPQMQHIGPLIARRIQDWGIDFARSAWHNPTLITDEVWQGYMAPLQIENWDRALWELTAASRANRLDERLGELTLPILVITGDDDRIVPTTQSVRLAQELPNARLTVIPACGHIAHEECPAPTLEAINQFLASLDN
ncbi:MAG TPA: alpha/beta hydrolase [Chloroflexi bacterium]|nr:alpha/beta hydrolase [Chloroflexota bacterium]HHW86529.1 alpha/beta hydrolase [Chloroflexota bacterium]